MQEQNLLWEQIKPLAGKYDSLVIGDKIKLLQFIQKDIQQERQKLASELERLDAILNPITELPAKKFKTGRRGRVKGTMSTSDAIVTFLNDGKVKDKSEIREGVAKIKGKVSEASITGTLMKLTKKKALKNPSRGKYQLGD